MADTAAELAEKHNAMVKAPCVKGKQKVNFAMPIDGSRRSGEDPMDPHLEQMTQRQRDRRRRRRAVLAGLSMLSLTMIPVALMETLTSSQAAPVPPNTAPVADLVLNPPAGSAPLTVVGDGSGSTDDQEVVSYAFSWGDGKKTDPEPDATASHVYGEPGSYVVKLTIRDNRNRIATTSRTIEIAPPSVSAPDAPPVARVTAKKTASSDVIIDGGESVDDRGITGYRYDFGDGSRTVSQPSSTVRHHYKKSGTYEIRLTVTDTAGTTSTATTTMSITAAAEPTSPLKSTVVSFTFDDTFANQVPAADVLKSRGLRGTFYVNSPRIGSSSTYMSRSQVDAIAASGHEIPGHTLTHANLPTVTATEAKRQVCDDRTALTGMGFQSISFAYPFGATNDSVKQITKGCGYVSARGVGSLRSPGYGCLSCDTAETLPATDPYEIRTNKSVQSDTTVEMLKTYVTQAENDQGGWVPLVFHSICSGCASNSMDIASFTAFTDWISTRPSSTQVKTVGEVMAGSAPTATATATPTPTATATATATPTPTPTTTAPTVFKSVTIGTQTRALNGTNVARLSNYLVLYTPAYGASTKTNVYGYEAAVVGGKVTKVANGVGTMAIPSNGYVLSGHGTSRTWLSTYAKVGVTVRLN